MDGNMNRKIHAAAGRIAGRANAHQAAKEKASDLFGVASLRDLSNDQAHALLLKLNADRVSQESQVRAAREIITGEKTITPPQVAYAASLFRQLGWSDEYVGKFAWNRYQESIWKAMPEWKAIRMIGVLQKRLQGKKKRETSRQGKETEKKIFERQLAEYAEKQSACPDKTKERTETDGR